MGRRGIDSKQIRMVRRTDGDTFHVAGFSVASAVSAMRGHARGSLFRRKGEMPRGKGICLTCRYRLLGQCASITRASRSNVGPINSFGTHA